MSRRWLAGAAAAVLATVALLTLGGWYVLFGDVSEPASVSDAVLAFRDQAASGTGGDSPIPVGVYVYDTDGSEQTDALRGATHRYPTSSTITVTDAPCGVRLRWDILEGRFSTWTLCAGKGGLTEKVRDERHTFFGVGDQTTYTCSGTPFLPPEGRPGSTFRVSCTTGSATELGRGRVVGREQIDVGGRRVESVHVRTATRFEGDTTGRATFDFWLARDTGLPVEVTMVSRTTSGSLIGDVHYEEDVSLALTSLTARR